MARLSHVADSVQLGDTFGRWTVVGAYKRVGDGAAVFPVKCACGTAREVRLKYLRNGDSRSCGCLQKDVQRQVHTKHGIHAQGRRAVWLWNQYRLTLEDFDELVVGQGGRCAVCEDELLEPRVDHDHTTGQVRGLLCHHCNVALGHLRDDVDLFVHAIGYLRKSQRARTEGTPR